APIDDDGRELLATALRSVRLSARGLARVRRVACTLGDLAGHRGPLGTRHVAPALQHRAELDVATGMAACAPPSPSCDRQCTLPRLRALRPAPPTRTRGITRRPACSPSRRSRGWGRSPCWPATGPRAALPPPGAPWSAGRSTGARRSRSRCG